jgi:hypothetical protein
VKEKNGFSLLEYYISEQNKILDRRKTKDYGSSLIVALSKVYPDYNWEPWKFKSIVTEDNAHLMIHDLEGRMNIKSPEDWYTVDMDKVEREEGKTKVSILKGNDYKTI